MVELAITVLTMAVEVAEHRTLELLHMVLKTEL